MKGLYLSRIPTSGKIGQKWGTHDFLDRINGILQAGAVAGGVAGAGRPKRSCLTKREIASEDREASFGKRVGQDAKHRGLRISTRAMGQDQCIPVGRFGSVQETAYFRIGRFLDELRDGDFRQATILNGEPTRNMCNGRSPYRP